MASSRVKNHVHMYVRYKKRPGYYRCAASDCTHFLDSESVLGKASLCNDCGNQMILTKEDLRRVKPKCIACSNTKKSKIYKMAQLAALRIVMPTDQIEQEEA